VPQMRSIGNHMTTSTIFTRNGCQNTRDDAVFWLTLVTGLYSPVHYFQLYFPDSVFDLMETEVNRFATQRLDTTADMPPSSRFHQWKDTDAVEMKAYVALNIAMGLCNKPSIADYWGTYWLTHTPFKQVMSRNRYQMLYHSMLVYRE